MEANSYLTIGGVFRFFRKVLPARGARRVRTALMKFDRPQKGLRHLGMDGRPHGAALPELGGLV